MNIGQVVNSPWWPCLLPLPFVWLAPKNTTQPLTFLLMYNGQVYHFVENKPKRWLMSWTIYNYYYSHFTPMFTLFLVLTPKYHNPVVSRLLLFSNLSTELLCVVYNCIYLHISTNYNKLLVMYKIMDAQLHIDRCTYFIICSCITL